MSSKLDICNLALINFGGGKITSFDDGKEQSRVLDLKYSNCVESMLEAFPWNFSQHIALMALSIEEVPGWDYVYQYPADCVKVWAVYDESGKPSTPNEFRVMSDGTLKYVCCNIDAAYVEYSAKVNDSSLYPAAFVKALSYLLAAEVVNQLSGNSGKSTEMMQKYGFAVGEAMLSGAVEGNVQPAWSTRYVTGRA